jgi:hypothetical protein
MAVPTNISELSTTAGSNPPSGSDSPTVTDDHFRAAYSFIAELRDDKADSADAVLLTGNQTIAGTKTFSSAIVSNLTGNVTGNVTGTAANVTGTVAIANGGTGQTTASAAFGALKQAASTSATGVVELSTDTEAQTGTDTARAVTPANLNAVVPGMGQTLNDVTGARAFNTNYVNGVRVRFINITATSTAGSATGNSIGIQINGGSQVIGSGAGAAGGGWPLSTVCIIPPGATYRANCNNATLGQWLEFQ